MNMTSEQYCKAKTRASGSSFAYAFGFLSEDKSRAMMALYAFCREVDDIADDITDKQEANRQIQAWRNEITHVFDSKPSHPIGHELNWARQHFAWDKELFDEMLDGMHTDIEEQPFVKNSDLTLYCYRVAGVVGLLSIEVFGYQHRQSRAFATTLAEALQITNILRDLQEDAQRSRIYLPQCERARFHVHDQDIIDGHLSDNLKALIQYYANKAEGLYQQALKELPQEDRVTLRPAIMMAAVYHTYLQQLIEHGYDVWKRPLHISSWKKVRMAWHVWRYEKKYQASQDSAKFPLRLNF